MRLQEAAYFDNNATTRVSPEVIDAMLPYLRESYGNPSSTHCFGDQAAHALRRARHQVQALIGAEHPSEIIFTSCGSESDSTALYSALRARPERKEVITTQVEHPAILNACKRLERDEGYKVHWLGVDEKGRLNIKAYRKTLSKRVAIASIMWANNETGTLFPVEEMADLAHAADVTFHTDAVQAVGKIGISLKKTKIDMLSLSAHKLHAMKGVGVLYLRQKLRFHPLLHGGRQERGRRAGTENIPGIVALGRAAELAIQNLDLERGRVSRLRDTLENALLSIVPNSFVAGDLEHRLPNTSNLIFEYIDSKSLLLLLNKAGIAASSGSACTAGALEPSHVLRAMGHSYARDYGSVRFSLSLYTTDDEVKRVIDSVPAIIAKLRLLSSEWPQRAPPSPLAPSLLPSIPEAS